MAWFGEGGRTLYCVPNAGGRDSQAPVECHGPVRIACLLSAAHQRTVGAGHHARPASAPPRLSRLVVALLVTLGLGCATPQAPPPSFSTLRFVWTGDLTALWHPAAYQTYSQGVIFWLVFNNLVKLDDDLETVIPDLAESWEVSEDLRVFTFRLRNDVTWHDGRPFTARDVIFSFTRQVIETYRYVKFLKIVKGARDYETGKASRVEGLELLDDYTVRITLDSPDAIFLLSLSEPNCVIVPEHLLKDTPPDDVESTPFSTTSPIGTGPYTFVRYLTDQFVELEANPNYFKGAPRIQKIFMKRLRPEVTVAQLESGEVDLALRLNLLEFDRLSQVADLDLTVRPGLSNTSLDFPVEQPRVADKRLRQAIYYAVDRERIAKAIFSDRAQVLYGAPPAMDGYDTLNRYPFDPDKARRLLEEAGFDFDAPFRVIYDQTYPAASQYFPIIEQQLREIGMNVTLEAMDSTAFLARMMGARDTFEMFGLNGGVQGLGPHLTGNYFDCERKAFLTGYSNCDFDALFVEARGIADPEQRQRVYERAAQVFNEDLPQLPLWTPHELHAATKRLGGGFAVQRDPKRTFTNAETWTLQ